MFRTIMLRKVLIIGLLILFTTTHSSTVSAGTNIWTSNGPEGGAISVLAIDPANPNTLYAGAWGGVFKSTNGGGSWSAVNTGLTYTAVLTLLIDPATPSTLYVGTSWYLGTGYGCVFKSTNGGESWSAVNTGLKDNSVEALAIDPATPSTLYAGTNRGGVFKSTNGGESWSEVNTGLTEPYVQALAIDPATPSTLYAGTWGGVFKSTNSGESWSAVNLGLTSTDVYALAIDPATPSTLYVGTLSGGVFKSTNGGGSWSEVSTGLTSTDVNALAIDPVTSSTLYAGTNRGGVFKSTNSGGSWSEVSTGLTSTDVYALAIDPATPSTLYAGTYGGVFKSTDGGGSWSAVNTGLSNADVLTLAIDPATPSTLYAGTWGGVFKSTNGGGSWSEVNTNLTDNDVRALAIDPAAPNTLYAGTYGGVFKSTNGGGSWSVVNTGLTGPYVQALAIDPATPSTIYAGTGGDGVFRSTDGGASWSAVNTGLTETNILTLAIDPMTSSTIYAGTVWGGGVFKSTNGGGSWSAVNTGLANTDIQALAIDPATPSTLYAGTWGDGLFKSTNGGESWSAFNIGMTNTIVQALAIDPATPSTIYAGTLGGGIFKSTNGGWSWSAFNTDLTNTVVQALAIDPDTPSTLYAGTGGGGVFDMQQLIEAPAISSAGSETFTVGEEGIFTVTTTGYPTPTIMQSGTLPGGVTFADNGDGTGTLAGTPENGTGGDYNLTFTASNGVLPDAEQSFTLTVILPMTTWYLAEGYTGQGFGTYILIQNPNDATAIVDVTYMLQGGGTINRQHIVPANSRYTIVAQDPGEVGLDQAFSTKLFSSLSIIVERAMYFATGGHGTIGVTSPEYTWYLAEGYTGQGFGTYILIQNPNDTTATVDVTYMLQGGGTLNRQHIVPANSRYTIVAQDTAEVGLDQAFSTRLSSDLPIIVERAMYFSTGGHDTIGVTSPADTWYLAEGYTGQGFGTYILVQNANDSTATVDVTYMLQGGGTLSRQHSVPANSRYTIVAQDPGEVGLDQAFSTKLSSNLPIIVERAMYFANGGHGTIGATSPANTWYLAEGYTGDGFGTYIPVQNPNEGAATVDVTYMLQGGGTLNRQHIVPANSRYTIVAQDPAEVGLDQAFSTMLSSDIPIIVERAMYFANGGHDTIGVTLPSP